MQHEAAEMPRDQQMLKQPFHRGAGSRKDVVPDNSDWTEILAFLLFLVQMHSWLSRLIVELLQVADPLFEAEKIFVSLFFDSSSWAGHVNREKC